MNVTKRMTRRTLAFFLAALLAAVSADALADDTVSGPKITVVNKTSTDLNVKVAKRGATTVVSGGSYSFSAGATCDAVSLMTQYFTQVIWPEPPHVGCNFSKCGAGDQAGSDWSRAVFTCHYYPSGSAGGSTPLYEPEFDPKTGDIILSFTDADRIGKDAAAK